VFKRLLGFTGVLFTLILLGIGLSSL